VNRDLAGRIFESRFQGRNGAQGLHLPQLRGRRLANQRVGIAQSVLHLFDRLRRQSDRADSGNSLPAAIEVLWIVQADFQHFPG